MTVKNGQFIFFNKVTMSTSLPQEAEIGKKDRNKFLGDKKMWTANRYKGKVCHSSIWALWFLLYQLAV